MMIHLLRTATFLLLALLHFTANVHAQTATTSTGEIPPATREFRGVWLTTVNNMDWPSTMGLTTEQQKAEMIEMLDVAVSLRLNVIVFQVRTSCDALYKSDLEPWSEFLSGQMGKAPEPFYDPLQFAIEESHKRGLELHAWFNPYRARFKGKTSPAAATHISKTKPELVKNYGGYLWLDPGEKETQDHSFNVMMDVVKRYDIDAVHMDDYFYPYKDKDTSGTIIAFPDDASYRKYVDGGGDLNRDDWRRDNVNKFIQRLNTGMKQIKPTMRFGISPFGIWRPGNPPGVNGLDQYKDLYADARLWVVEGWTDYIAPQLYWPLGRPQQKFEDLLRWWVEQNKPNHHVLAGLYTSRTGMRNTNGHDETMIARMIQATRAQPGAHGNIHFSAEVFKKNGGKINDTLKSSVYAGAALVPASTWLDSTPPDAPKVWLDRADGTGTGTTVLRWEAQGKERAFVWAVYGRVGDAWKMDVIPAGQTSYQIARAGTNVPTELAVSAVDRLGKESDRAVIQLKPPQ